MTPQLVSGSESAHLPARIWSDETDIVYLRDHGWGWVATATDALRLLGRLSGETPSMLVLCPGERSAREVEERLAMLAGVRVPPHCEWFEIPRHHTGRRATCAEVRAGTRMGARWEDHPPDLVLLHPRMTRRRLQQAVGRWPSCQVLATPRSLAAFERVSPVRVPPRSFGPVPFEVLLAGAAG